MPLDHEGGHHSPQERLVHMANQIATFFATQPGQSQAEGVANHLRTFWEPRMLNQLYALIDGGADGISPLVIEAVRILRTRATA
ncbi:MAG: formate dehydrogenase subunit delta [Rubellimicrobium sp.]|nr:formate dehydrogenase subunit delta [Rubellimicrobium sp.]